MHRRRSIRRRRPAAVLGVAIATLLLAACSNKQRLGEYDYRGRSLALVTIAPPHPEVLTGMDVDVDTDNPVASLIRAGAEIAREASVANARTRLDSAAAAVDVGDRMGDRVLRDVARYLRARPVEGAAAPAEAVDYEIEVRVRRYGIVADSWTSGAYFRIDAEMMLLDGETGRRIWETDVRATEPVRHSNIGVDDRSVGNVVTAISLAEMSVAEIERALEGLADFAADHLVREFAEALDEARG